MKPVNPVQEPQRVERAQKVWRADKTEKEKAPGYQRPDPAPGKKAALAARRMDAMLGAMSDLRSRASEIASAPVAYASGEGGSLTAWDAGGAQLQSISVTSVAMATEKGAASALMAQAVYQTSDGARIEASFATLEIEGYGSVTFATVTMDAPEADYMAAEAEIAKPASVAAPASLEVYQGEDADVALKAEGFGALTGFTGDGDDAINLQAQLVAQFDAGGGNDIMTVSAKMGVNLFAGLGDDIMHVKGDYLRNISGDGGDDIMLVEGRDVSGVFGGAGNDSIHVKGEQATHVNGGAGDDIIALWSQRGSLDVTPGGGKDIVTLGEAGDYAVNISPALAQSAEDVEVKDLGGGAVRLSFKDGSQTTLMGVDKAGGLKIGNENWSLDLKAKLAETV